MKSSMTPEKNASFIPLPPRPRLVEREQRDNGDNDHEADFLLVAQLLLDHYESFTLQTVYRLLKSKEIEPSEIQTLFYSWTRKMVLQKRLLPVAGAYEEISYQVL